ncbi:hypothetical protein CMI47_14725 [Candidatus Pacearchaeota archaeon]|nr:hypothetical protein [Candidatus Pacearchaeota archaeon]|tara:strand:+ start:5327 stop:5728 length:402 start_codon:yes stop_codon:yes gene_type:complete
MTTRPIAVWGNMDSGHGPFPPTPAILPVAPGGTTTKTPLNPYSASGNVKVGCVHKNVGVHRQFDVRIPHISVSSPFPPELFTNAGAYNGGLLPYTKNGSKTVKTNGVETARVGSPVICSSKILSGIKTVMIGE